ncbi:hypothetical protein [Campylobacter novaezeelandiae]|nr:hypothetical protein [Campylobacter novaezeelandiae]
MIIASLYSVALALNHSYHSKKNLSNLQQEFMEGRSMTCGNIT